MDVNSSSRSNMRHKVSLHIFIAVQPTKWRHTHVTNITMKILYRQMNRKHLNCWHSTYIQRAVSLSYHAEFVVDELRYLKPMNSGIYHVMSDYITIDPKLYFIKAHCIVNSCSLLTVVWDAYTMNMSGVYIIVYMYAYFGPWHGPRNDTK